MSEHPNTARGDAAYWGLTYAQAAGYHARLSRMYADRATRFADLSTMYARRATIASRISLTFAALALALLVVSWVIA